MYTLYNIIDCKLNTNYQILWSSLDKHRLPTRGVDLYAKRFNEFYSFKSLAEFTEVFMLIIYMTIVSNIIIIGVR